MSKGKTVFILGAGATRGCSFVNEMKGKGRCLPPLDGDFFTQLQRVSSKVHSERITRLIEGLAKWFGTNYTLSMEQVFCHFEHAPKMAHHLGKDDDKIYSEITKLKEDLEQAIAIILGESLTEVKAGGKGSYELSRCKWHDTIIEKLADKGDAFINFNYDSVLDDSLRRKGADKWNPHYGYGLPLKRGGHKMKGEEYWAPTLGNVPKREETITVHKVHGSLHFNKDKGGYLLKQRPYANPHAKSSIMKFMIVPPESAKSYDVEPIGKIMLNAYASLRAATRVVIIGYSLPPSDQHAEALLRFGIKRDSLDSLVIVNPDQGSRKRLRTALERGIKASTRVHSFDYLSEFAQADPTIWKI
jgi:hypothetical protein